MMGMGSFSDWDDVYHPTLGDQVDSAINGSNQLMRENDELRARVQTLEAKLTALAKAISGESEEPKEFKKPDHDNPVANALRLAHWKQMEDSARAIEYSVKHGSLEGFLG